MSEVTEGEEITYTLSKQTKECGHDCFPSTTSLCCVCSDIRPVLDGDYYPMYIDGAGWKDEASRNSYYCHVCNPKNYSEWKKRILIERQSNFMKKLKHQEILEAEMKQLDLDHIRAATIESTISDLKHNEEDSNNHQNQTNQTNHRKITFEYSNGDIYEGYMHNGLREGYGIMNYNDGSQYTGYWINDLKNGKGTRNWYDGIVYTGEWKNDMMEGSGKYIMADGTIIEGKFEKDEFVE